MQVKLNIYEKPTYDLKNIELINFIEDEGILTFKTKDVFHFDKVYGNITIRSRVLREGRKEFDLVENIISAIIDAGYYGYLCGKIKLTKAGIKLCKDAKKLSDLTEYFENCQQIYLFQSLAGNYYDGTSNRPDLKPDIIFTL